MGKDRLMRSTVTVTVDFDRWSSNLQLTDQITSEGQEITIMCDNLVSWNHHRTTLANPTPGNARLTVLPLNDPQGPVLAFMFSQKHGDEDSFTAGFTAALPLDVARDLGKRIDVIAKMAENGKHIGG